MGQKKDLLGLGGVGITIKGVKEALWKTYRLRS